MRTQQDANATVPVEISRILYGAVSFFQGGLGNEGTTTWYALDIDRRLLVALLCSAGDRPRNIPSVEKLTANQLSRYTDAAGYRRAEYVTVATATPGAIRAFSYLANKLLGTETKDVSRPICLDTLTKTFSLLHRGKSLDLGAGQKRWEIEIELEHLISQPLQEPIMQAS